MAKDKGSKQFYQTPGGIIAFGEGQSNDAGCGTPPAPTEYGRPGTGEFPTGGDRGSNKPAINSYFNDGKKGGKY